MRLRSRFFILLLLPLLPLTAAHGTDWNALANDPEWQALLHVNRGATLHGRGESYVDDKRFFIAENGKRNPQHELAATVAALEPAGAEARCRFPARYAFLARRLGWSESQPLAHCTEYNEWRRQIPSARAVLVFPASYLNSPSSMFGHTLMRLDASTAPENVWNSWAINFGAVTTGQDNSILYVWRGLAGGYPGLFSIVPYVSKIQEYSNLENRDIWEYTLKLEPAQINRLVDHLWELRDINFDYYFFDENCSFRLLELIDVALPESNVIQGLRITEEPVNTVRTLYRHDLISERVYRPSKASELQADIDVLTPQEQKLARQLLRDPAFPRAEEFLAQPADRQHLMARTALRTLRFRERKKERSDASAEIGIQLLYAMQATPAPDVTIPPPAPPENGHDTQMFTLGGGRLGTENFSEIGYRFTYHDLIDNPDGFLNGAQIEGLSVRLRHSESSSLKLESLDLVNIRSLSPRNAFIKPLSWFVQAGWERVPAQDERALASFVQGGAGLSWRWGPVQPYALASLRAEHESGQPRFIAPAAGGSLGLLWYHRAAQLNVMADGLRFEGGEYRYRGQAEVNVPLGRHDALRFAWQQEHWPGDHVQEISLGWRHHFP